MKPKIEKISLTREQQEEIDRINAGKTVPKVRTITNKKTGVKQDIITNRRFTFEMGHKRLVELYGGICRCSEWPAYKVLYNVGDENQGAWLVERYCQKCFDLYKERIK